MKLFSKEWFDSKPRRLALSFVVAVSAWCVVALSVNRITTRTIEGVKIELPAFGASYQALGLDIVDNGKDYTCSVTVSGDRTVIGALTPDSFSVVPDFTPVNSEGTYTLRLKTSKTNQLLDFEIRSTDPSGITLTFGNVESRKFPVQPEVEGVSVAEGYVLQNIISSPQNITIIGETALLDRIDRVVATASLPKELSASASVKAEIAVIDRDGNPLSLDSLKLDSTAAELTVPVFKEAEIPLSVGFINIPDGFDESILKYSLSQSTLRVAAVQEAVEAIAGKTVGYIDMSELVPGVLFNFPVQLANGFVNLDHVDSILVSVDFSGMTSRKLDLSDIRLENAPEGFEIRISDSKISNVQFVGAEEQVERLSASSVAAVVDAAEIPTAPGRYAVPVHFIIPSCDGVWAAGSYTVTVEVIKN